MSRADWYFLVDEDIEPRVVELLEEAGIRADHVPEALFQGADDEADILPYALANEAIIVTSNWRDFTRFDTSDHYGCIVEFGQDQSASQIASALLAAVDHYNHPDDIEGWDKLEYWLDQA